MNEDINNLNDSFKHIDKVLYSLESINEQMLILNQTCLNVVKNLESINQVGFSDILNGFSDILAMGASIATITGKTASLTSAASGLSTTLMAIPTPITLIAGAFVGLLALVAIFGESEATAAEKTRLFNEAQETKRNELIETSKAINEATASAINNAKNAEIQSEVLKGFVGNLKGLADENDFVKNFEKAQYYVNQINSAMPGTVKLTEDGKLAWLENAEAIDENIKQLERKAKVEAYYDGYVESLKNETKFRSELTLAQNNYNSELEKQQGYQNSINELLAISRERTLTPSETEALTTYTQKLSESNETLDQYSLTLDKAKGAYEANAKGAELYQSAVGALDGSIEASAKLQLEEYTALDENGKLTWDSLAAASEDCKNRITTAHGVELETFKNNLVTRIINLFKSYRCAFLYKNYIFN